MKILVLVLALAAGGCIATSSVGPFVKHVQRNGDWLVIHKCLIVLEGDTIRESNCTAEQIPLRSLPMAPQAIPPPGTAPTVPSTPRAP
jgi:hypothetical protein